VGTITDFISSQFKTALGGDRGPDRDTALDDFFLRLAAIAEAAGIRVKANYGASRRRVRILASNHVGTKHVASKHQHKHYASKHSKKHYG
jgi:hypothetical protein